MESTSLFLLIFALFQQIQGQNICPPGLSPLYSSSNSNQPQTCTPQDSCSCYSTLSRLGAICQYSTVYSNYICCASTNTQCGTNSSPQTSLSGQIVTCSASTQCANGYVCNYGTCCPNATSSLTCKAASNCLTGQVLVNGQCYNSVNIGSACQRSEQCVGGSQCTQSICQCQTGYVNVNQQCVINNGINCPLGSVSYNSNCISLASPGQSCVTPTQCIDNSTCNNGMCTCNYNYNLVYGYCVPISNGNCKNTETLINNQCVLYSIVGEPCIATAQCVGGAQCTSATCQCTNGYTAMYGYCIRTSSSSGNCNSNQVFYNNQCWNTVQIGGQCLFSQQCLGNSQCLNSFCQCPSGSTNINGYCQNGGQNGQCNSNQIFYNNQCLNTVQIGAQCLISQQCLGNSQCLNSFCQCPNGWQNVGGQCKSSSSSSNLCGSGQQMQVDSSGQPINCLVATCPSNSFCQYSSTGMRYVCCSSSAGKK